jgi:hypothetical protein
MSSVEIYMARCCIGRLLRCIGGCGAAQGRLWAFKGFSCTFPHCVEKSRCRTHSGPIRLHSGAIGLC